MEGPPVYDLLERNKRVREADGQCLSLGAARDAEREQQRERDHEAEGEEGRDERALIAFSASVRRPAAGCLHNPSNR